jgi:hypothetical protein
LWSAPAGVCHSHYSRSIFRNEAEHLPTGSGQRAHGCAHDADHEAHRWPG